MIQSKLAFLPAEILLGNFGNIFGNFLIRTVADFYPEFQSQLQQFLFIFNLIAGSFSFGYCMKKLNYPAAVIAMGSRSGSNHPGKVTGGNGLCGSSANTFAFFLIFRSFLFALWQRYPARSHSAVFTATAFGPDRTGFHSIRSIKSCTAAVLMGFLNHFQSSLINTFDIFLRHFNSPSSPDRFTIRSLKHLIPQSFP